VRPYHLRRPDPPHDPPLGVKALGVKVMRMRS
jgi:hypothetical protein